MALAQAVRLPTERPRVVGRYTLFDEIAAGGMATVHLGRLLGPAGFSRTVAIKRLHPQFAKDPDFVSMFLDEARLASRIQHPNVVATLDVVQGEGELFLVMEYVEGEVLSRLMRSTVERGELVPAGIAAALIADLLNGLHAAHEAKSENREPLNIVHRDVSPQNVIVGVDGVARVLDFGVAKAAMRAQTTRDGQIKGKLSYMSPEQLNGKDVDRRADVFAAGVVGWEVICGKRLFAGDDAGEIFGRLINGSIPTPNEIRAEEKQPPVPVLLNNAIMRALARDPDQRYKSAREFAIAVEAAVPVAPPHKVGQWVEDNAGPELGTRTQMISTIERYTPELLETFAKHEPTSTLAERVRSPEDATQADVRSARHPSVRPKRRGAWLLVGSLLIGSAAAGALAWPELRPLHLGLSNEPQVPAATEVFSAEKDLLLPQTAPTALPPTPAEAAPVASAQAAPSAGPLAIGSSGGSASEAPNASECTPPWQIDANGIRRTKPGCAAPSQKAPRAKPDCEPPWRVDARGIRRPKPGCY